MEASKILLGNGYEFTFPIHPDPNILAQVAQAHSMFPRGALRLKTLEKVQKSLDKTVLGMRKAKSQSAKVRKMHQVNILRGKKMMMELDGLEDGKTPTHLHLSVYQALQPMPKEFADKTLCLYFQVGREMLQCSLHGKQKKEIDEEKKE